MRAATILAFAFALAGAGCATDPETAELRAKLRQSNLSGGTLDIAKKEGKVDLVNDQRVKCERYTPLGSHRVQMRCTTLTEAETAEEANKREMRKLQTPPPSDGARSIGGH